MPLASFLAKEADADYNQVHLPEKITTEIEFFFYPANTHPNVGNVMPLASSLVRETDHYSS